MKNRFIVLFLLSIALLVPLSAASTDGGSGGGFTPIYAAVSKNDFTIRAYKNTSSNVTLTLYDALVSTLDQINMDQELVLDNFIGKFIDAQWNQDIKKARDKVLFSYLIAGNSVGTYTLTFSFLPFKNEGATENNVVNAHFDVMSTRNRFKSGAVSVGTSSITDAAKMTVTPADGVVTATGDTVAKDLSIQWTVSDSASQNTTSELWTAEGVIVMALNKAEYAAAVIGDYRSTVTVKLEVL